MRPEAIETCMLRQGTIPMRSCRSFEFCGMLSIFEWWNTPSWQFCEFRMGQFWSAWAILECMIGVHVHSKTHFGVHVAHFGVPLVQIWRFVEFPGAVGWFQNLWKTLLPKRLRLNDLFFGIRCPNWNRLYQSRCPKKSTQIQFRCTFLALLWTLGTYGISPVSNKLYQCQKDDGFGDFWNASRARFQVH